MDSHVVAGSLLMSDSGRVTVSDPAKDLKVVFRKLKMDAVGGNRTFHTNS